MKDVEDQIACALEALGIQCMKMICSGNKEEGSSACGVALWSSDFGKQEIYHTENLKY